MTLISSMIDGTLLGVAPRRQDRWPGERKVDAMKTINPCDEFGPVLKTRFLGEKLRSTIEQLLNDGEVLRIDFAEVEAMSHAFADECFGALFCEFGAQLFRHRLHLTNLNAAVKSVLRLVLIDRRDRSRA